MNPCGVEQRQLAGDISRRPQVRILPPPQNPDRKKNGPKKNRDMTKTYKANTCIGINVVLASKKNLHITFIPQSDGSSVFITDKEDVQQALERHYRFGTLFRLAGARNAPQPAPREAEPAQAAGDAAEKETGKNSVRRITVSDFGAAKEYLADHFSITRTSMRSQKQILEQAAAHGIEFEGLS